MTQNHYAPWTTVREQTGVSNDDYLRTHYANTDTAQLARILGRCATAIAKRANKLGLTKNTLADEVLRLAAMPGGFRGKHLDGRSTQFACRKLLEQGLIHKIARSSKDVCYVTEPTEMPAKAARTAVVTISKSRKGWGKGDPPFFDPEHPPKITIAPPLPTPKYIRTGWESVLI